MTTKKPVWKRSPPATSKHRSLSPAKKSAAKRRAKRAGRPYPNLVDNMRAARKTPKPKKRKSAKRGARKKN